VILPPAYLEGDTSCLSSKGSPNLLHIPFRYIAMLLQTDLSHLQPVAKRIAIASGAENFNILQNNGRVAHQFVDHVCSPKLLPALSCLLTSKKCFFRFISMWYGICPRSAFHYQKPYPIYRCPLFIRTPLEFYIPFFYIQIPQFT
jgi:hypothetical protein